MAAIMGGLPAFALDLEGLAKNSPFGGTGAATGPGAAPSTLEFRGMYREEGINYYSIYNTLTKQSSWVAEGEAASTNVPVVVKGFDAVNETLTVDNGGQPQQMALHQAVVVTYKGPSPAQLACIRSERRRGLDADRVALERVHHGPHLCALVCVCEANVEGSTGCMWNIVGRTF